MSVARSNPPIKVTLDTLIDAEGGKDKARDRIARAGLASKADYLDVLHRDFDLAIRALEADRKHYQKAPEDLMSRVIAAQMKSCGYDAVPDPHEGGHVDIYIQSTRLNLRWAGEAKIHSGYEKAVDGVRQLVTRYASGFDLHGGFFLYVFVSNAAKVAVELRDAVQADAACKVIRIVDDPVPFRFVSVHSHEGAGVEYSVRHHLLLMNFTPEDKSARAVASRKAAKAAKAAVANDEESMANLNDDEPEEPDDA